MSRLRWYRSDPSHIISRTEIEIQHDMTYSEEPIRILAREYFGNGMVSKQPHGARRSYEKIVP
ncbi:receptor-like protein kinase [Gossypium australe]|uniref:Receptor-like protein kinase n=1 Tax=Gossypium australe TaxID=47621 RepID=A0A5B6VAH5_9ROSI|nr:receptor-like protein kinase [Gossypium australe]